MLPTAIPHPVRAIRVVAAHDPIDARRRIAGARHDRGRRLPTRDEPQDLPLAPGHRVARLAITAFKFVGVQLRLPR